MFGAQFFQLLGSLAFPVKQMPVVLPHKLIPWLLRHGKWPDIPKTELQQYWVHQEFFKTGIAAPSREHHPLWIWGDDCRYGSQNQKVMVCSMGHALDPNKNS